MLLRFHRRLARRRRLGPGLEGGDLPAGQVQLQRRQLGGHLAVAAGGVGLALEGTQLAPHLTQEVLQAQQVGFSGGQPALGLLLAAPVLQDAGRLLDHRPTVLRPGLEHRVELALGDDHVLRAAHAAVGQQLLDVEQPAGRTVDGVLALA